MDNIAAASVEELLQVNNLTREVISPEGSLTILDDVSFNVRRGQSVAIVGASGSGKSTLLGLLAGLDLPTRGSVRVDGKDITQLDEDGRAAMRAAHVGFVFQSFHLLPALTAWENVMLPMELAGDEEAAAAAKRILADVGLADRITHYPHQLSGGEQQRVALARAFCAKPDLLLADEPTGNLDTATGHNIIELLFDLNQRHGTTLVMVTHDPELADRCERRLTLVAGRLDSQA